jgi:glycosyltransferase involved in cell wall biosynthesis
MIWPLQRETLTRAACLHATAEEEFHHIRKMDLSAPVAIIPNGIDMPTLHHHTAGGGRKQLLFLGRIHPTKGLDLLLQVWQKIERLLSEWELRIIGPDNGGYLEEMKTLSKEMDLRRVYFEDALYGEDKWRAYQSADLYILPTHTENFGITVAEALANGVPAIVTTGAPWEGLKHNDCGWWINRDEQTLYVTLLEAMSLSRNELREMGERGRSWMESEFSWDEIGRKMHLTYEWLLGGGPPPDWVRVK